MKRSNMIKYVRQTLEFPYNSNTVAYLSEKFQRIWRLSDNIGGPIFKMPLNEIAVHVDGGYFIQPISTFFFQCQTHRRIYILGRHFGL